MSRIRSTLLTTIAAAGALIMAVQVAMSGDTPIDLGVSSTLAPAQITLHEPVIMAVQITSRATQQICIDMGWKFVAAFLIRVVTPDGKQIDLSTQVHRQGILGRAPGVARCLNPNEKFTQRIILNEWYTFDVPGNYQITTTTGLPVLIPGSDTTSEDRAKAEKREAQLNLKILPRDEVALKNRCEALMNRFQERSWITPEQYHAADELSYIGDPIAIPYLSKLAEAHVSLAVDGLARIGTDEAWEAMIAPAKSQYEPVAAKAKWYLQQNLAKIHDPKIREKIEGAIK